MLNRINLKEKGKLAFKKNYIRCVIVTFILIVFVSGNFVDIYVDVSNKTSTQNIEVLNEQTVYVPDDSTTVRIDTFNIPHYYVINKTAVHVLSAGLLLLTIFIFNPLEVGISCFFLENTNNNPSINKLLYSFKNKRYLNIVWIQLMKSIKLLLWSLLFIIPGIIKSYEYSMISYILAENPDMNTSEVFKLSKEMMDGHKWDLFILYLSFIGWILLSLITFNLSGLLYVNPYIEATKVEFYLSLKEIINDKKFNVYNEMS